MRKQEAASRSELWPLGNRAWLSVRNLSKVQLKSTGTCRSEALVTQPRQCSDVPGCAQGQTPGSREPVRPADLRLPVPRVTPPWGNLPGRERKGLGFADRLVSGLLSINWGGALTEGLLWLLGDEKGEPGAPAKGVRPVPEEVDFPGPAPAQGAGSAPVPTVWSQAPPESPSGMV